MLNIPSIHFTLCGMTTVSDVVGDSYRLHQSNRFDCMYEKTGETKLAAVCNPEYELLYEDGDIWFVHQHRMQASHGRPYMTPSQRRMFRNNRRDLGAVSVEAERTNSVSDNISMEKYLWLRDSGTSWHEANVTADIFDYSRIHSYLTIGNGNYLNSSRIGKKKLRIVQASGSTLDLTLCDCIYVPDICIYLTDYKSSTYNVLVAWETGESTYEPFDFIASDDPIPCAEYALKHNLLDALG
jgi:hypothetical protein